MIDERGEFGVECAFVSEVTTEENLDAGCVLKLLSLDLRAFIADLFHELINDLSRLRAVVTNSSLIPKLKKQEKVGRVSVFPWLSNSFHSVH